MVVKNDVSVDIKEARMKKNKNGDSNIKVKEKGKKNKNSILTILMFLLPALLVYSVFIIYPILSTINTSLYEWNGIGAEKLFIGLQNYSELLQDPAFWAALKNNMYVILVSIFVQIPLGLVMALILSSRIRGKKLLNVLFFMPYLMSTVAVGLLWVFIYDPVNGSVNLLLNFLGFESVHWLASSNTAIIAVLIVIAWQFAPFFMILFRASMVGIPEELYEASNIDGANSREQFFYITLPSLMPTIISSSILAVVGSLKTFDIFFVMLGGGSGNTTEILGTYMFRQSFVNFNMGYGSTIATMMLILALISVVVIQFIDFRRKKREAL